MSHPNPENATAAAQTTGTERWAMSHVPSHLRLWVGAVLGVAADLWTKELAFEKLQWGEARVVLENLCSLQKSLNPGALFGFGAGWAPIFVGASVLALLFVLYLFANSTTSRRSMHVALGLVLAGAIGNLYDRATQTAYVAHIPGKGRDIGILVQETESQVIIADFPDGGHRRMWPRPSDRRSGLQPVVRDFIKIEARIGGLSLWPWVFNVADALLVVGVVLLLLNLWAERRPRHRPRRTILPPKSV
jgi:lipoprotein signal peptidase